MNEYTYQDFENILEHITVRRKYLEGVHKQTQLLAHEGYVLHDKNDNGYTDEETEQYYPPTYSYQASFHPCYEETMFAIYEAVLIKEGMEIV